MVERRDGRPGEEMVTVPVAISLSNGREVSGCVVIARSASLIDAVNGLGKFIEFESCQGEHELLATSAICAMRPIAKSNGCCSTLARPARQELDPHIILGLAKGASRAEIRAAFHSLLMACHPDGHASTELMPQRTDELDARARGANAAYDMVVEEAIDVERLVAGYPHALSLFVVPPSV